MADDYLRESLLDVRYCRGYELQPFDGTRELRQPRQDCTWGYQWDRYGCRRKYTTTAPSFTRYTDVTC